MTVHQLPDLNRVRSLAAHVREFTAEQTADFLTTEDGMWLFAEGSPYVDADVRVKLTKTLCAGLLPGALFEAMGLTLAGGRHG
jgi:hypothetical protein